MTTQAIHKAMLAVMRDTTAIGKDSRNQQQGFMYRGIDSIYNALHGVLAKHGVFCTTEVLDRTREERQTNKGGILAFTMLRVRFTFHAEDGSSVSSVIDGEGMDSGDKSTNKALSVAHKYALLQAFCIPTEDLVDPDAESHAVASRQEPARPDEYQSRIADYKMAVAEAASLDALRTTWADAQEYCRKHNDPGAWSEIKALLERQRESLRFPEAMA